MAIRVLIADDHELFRSGLKQLLIDELGASEVREAANLTDALEVLTNEGPGDLILIDLRMPDMSGADALAALRDGFPEAKVVVVSALEERGAIVTALSAGVHGFVPKSLGSAEIASALRDVLAGKIYVPPAMGERTPGAPLAAVLNEDKLTMRQREVLDELLKGRASKEIARTLDIAEGTVKIHLAAIYRVLGVHTRAEAISKLKSRWQ